MNGRRWHNERRCDNQPDKRHERGHWQQKQQQMPLCNNQQKRNGTKMGSSSHQEVAARWLTWWHWLRNCRGGCNDGYDAEMATTTTTTMAAASVGSNVGMDAAALLRQWLTTTPTLTLTSASHDFCVGASRQQQQGRCCSAGGRTAQQERAAEGVTRAVGARRGLR